jgi:aminoglycoside phosphotransferase (APT) family kinase protein
MERPKASPAYQDSGTLERALAVYLDQQLGRAVGVSGLRRFAVGFSWITIGFTISAPGIGGCTELILRLGPADGLFAPYSAAPQFFALRALEGAGVPAPRAFLWSDDSTILGAPFFISELVQGEAPIPWGPAGGMPEELRDRLGVAFTDALGALHNVEWQSSGLATVGEEITVENAASRQLEEWERNYLRWRLRPHPMLHYAARWLRANLPTAPRVSIVHGDYRLGNFLAIGDRITAILDWELVHLGDPHEDLAWACLPQYRAGTKLMSRLIERDAMYQRYHDKTGIEVDPETMRFYEIFSLYKLAVTHMAAVSVFERNDFHDLRMPAMGTQIAPVLRQMEKALEALA